VAIAKVEIYAGMAGCSIETGTYSVRSWLDINQDNSLTVFYYRQKNRQNPQKTVYFIL